MRLDAIGTWIGSHDTGASSKAILVAALGGTPAYGWDYPYDVSDFGRCVRLLRKLPELRDPAFARLRREGGPIWRELIKQWGKIESMFEEEERSSVNRRFHKTYEMILAARAAGYNKEKAQ